MFGIEALDVVIGMIFVYLLFSLFVSIVNEVLSQFFQVRGKELKFAIEQMLSRRIRTRIYEDSKVNRSMFKSSLLYGTPLWKPYKKFMKVDGEKNKVENEVLPSHIHPGTFTEILAKLVRKDVDVLNDYIKSIEKKDPLQLTSLADIARYFSIEIQLEALIKEHEKRIAKSLELKKEQEELVKVKSPSEEQKKRLAKVKSLISNLKISVILDQEFLIDLLMEGHTQIDDLKKKIENRYDEVMAYTSSWYKSKLKYILLGLGLITAIIFNADSISIFKTLVNDEGARAMVVEQAQNYVDSHESENGYPVKVTLPDSTQKDSTVKGGYALRIFFEEEFESRLHNQLPDSFKTEKDRIRITDSLKTEVRKSISADYPTLAKIDTTYQQLDTLVEQDIEQLSSVLGLGWGNLPKLSSWAWFWDWIQRIFGWLITAIAISMGAPFWFDLLKKVVNIKNDIQNSGRQKERVG